MTYVTGQPIIFVGCGQVRASCCRSPLSLLLLTPPDLFCPADLYRPQAAACWERRAGHSQRLVSNLYSSFYQFPGSLMCYMYVLDA